MGINSAQAATIFGSCSPILMTGNDDLNAIISIGRDVGSEHVGYLFNSNPYYSVLETPVMEATCQRESLAGENSQENPSFISGHRYIMPHGAIISSVLPSVSFRNRTYPVYSIPGSSEIGYIVAENAGGRYGPIGGCGGFSQHGPRVVLNAKFYSVRVIPVKLIEGAITENITEYFV